MVLLRYLLFFAFIFTLLPLAFAQQDETGIISGSVKDEDGKGISGASITATNISLIGLKSSTYTSVDGYYRFPVLLPGEYEIKTVLQGFQSVVRKGVRLFVGQTVIVDFMLQPQALSEIVEIQVETPPFDTTSPSMSKTIPREEIENLPGFLGSVNLFTITPGVGEAARPIRPQSLNHVAYGSALGNLHSIDGADTTNRISRLPVVTPNYNWIEEIQVVSLGAPAEYGGFTGVIANSVSRSGSNQFHGLVEIFFQDDSFNSNNVVDEDITPNETIFTDTTAQLGGPILRDKLWFFVGLQYLFTKETLINPIDEEVFLTSKNPRFIGKSTYQANQNNKLQGFITYDNPNFNGLDGDVSLPEATWFDERPLWLWNFSWISFLKSQTYLDLRVRGVTGPRKVFGQDPNLPGHLDLLTGIASQNYCCYNVNDRLRNYVNGALSHYASDFLLGNHEFKFGAQYEHSRVDVDTHFNGNMFYLDYGGELYLRNVDEDFHSELGNSSISTFAQDDWQLTDQLNLSLGVRWDRVTNKVDEVEDDTDGIAPRVGFVYALNRNRATIIKMHYGHYSDNAGPVVNGDSYTFTKEKYNHETQEWEVVPTSPEPTFIIDDDLKQPYTRQFTTGIDHVFPKEVNFSAHYIYKKDENLIEDVDTTSEFEPVPYLNPITGETITVYNLVDPGDGTLLIANAPILFRRYHGFEIYGSKRLSNKLYLAGSIVFSRIKGNADNDGVEGTGGSQVLDSPNDQINSEGLLEKDVSTEIKFHGYYFLPWGINTSWYFRHFSGDTWTPLVQVRGQNQGPFEIYGLPRGSNRLPDRNTIDVRLEKMFPLYDGQLRLTLDVFNLFNTGYPLGVENVFGRDNFGKPTEFSAPREFRVGVRYTF
ncbi:MAG TPA: TonB-dependent receptor [Acidobacteriota bacterium]|nr:TonB-dependent receptor [Acidobacteriota bacterium]